MEGLILAHLLEHLAAVYPRPKAIEGIARRLAAYCPPHATDDAMAAAARRMIENRRSRAFPSMAELIEAVRYLAPPRPPKRTAAGYKPDFDETDREAIRLLRGTAIARQAVAEGWAPGLLDFVRKNGRLPVGTEITGAEAVSRRNDALAAGVTSKLREAVLKLRQAMHDYAERHLSGFAE